MAPSAGQRQARFLHAIRDKRRTRLFTALLLGALMASSQPPVGFWPALFLTAPALFLLWRLETRRGAFLLGWAAGAGFFAAALHWIIEPFLVDAATFGWMAPFALIFLAGGLGLFWGAAFYLAERVWSGPAHRWGPGAPGILAVFWALGECARSYVLTGFPWAIPAYAWIETPVAQTAALFGPYALSFFTLLAACLLGLFSLGRKQGIFSAALVLLALGSAWTWGAARLSHPAEATGPHIRIVQTNVNQRDKWTAENVRPNLEMLMALSETKGETAPALIIWPESAVTFPLDMSPDARAEIAARLNAPVAIGSLRLDGGPQHAIPPGAKWRNSLFLQYKDASLSSPFDKIHLVPFGEYLPLERHLVSLGLGAIASLGGGIVAGQAPILMETEGIPPFAPLICYEMIFPRETALAAKGAEWMVLITNDAWFGTWAGPAQHFAMARMRAIETGLPIARSANAGTSAMIDGFGRVQAAIGPARFGSVNANLPDSTAPTYYFKRAETLTGLALIVILAISTLGGKSHNFFNKKSKLY